MKKTLNGIMEAMETEILALNHLQYVLPGTL